MLSGERFDDIPVYHSDGVAQYRKRKDGEELFLSTMGLTKEDFPLGYSTVAGLREVKQLRPKLESIEEQLLEDGSIMLPEKTDIFLVSRSRNGNHAAVKLGFLKDGRPVALKTRNVDLVDKKDGSALGDGSAYVSRLLLRDYYAAQICDDLGIGPKVHGFYEQGGLEWMVMDIVLGDFPASAVSFITKDSFKEFGRCTGLNSS